MVDQKARTKIGINEETVEFLDDVASKTKYCREEMLEYSVRLLQTVMDWRQTSPSAADLEPQSIEEDLIDALVLARKIERLGGADRIVLERSGRERWDVTPKRSKTLLRKK